MTAPQSSRRDTEIRLLAQLAVCVSVFSFLFYFQRGDVLLYGDAVAHINIARRVFDSKTPGLLQLGTVWLPLPHLLMIPFLISNQMWREGIGGSIPSLAAYVFGVVGMFRLMRGMFSADKKPSAAARIGSWTAALVYAANPNLIYMETTAMGEAVHLAFFIWATLFFTAWLRGNPRALMKSGLCIAAACLTRYDGWFLAAVMTVAVVAISYSRGREENWTHSGAADLQDSRERLSPPTSSRVIVKFVLIAAAAPALWLAYNAIIYRNPLEFENGPYSAKAIEGRTQNSGAPGHPGTGNIYVAGLYFLKSAEENLAANQWLQRLWVLLGLLTIAGLLIRSYASSKPQQKFAVIVSPFLLLCLPLPFYALSVAYGGVPIFIPSWWPFTHYNARYGLELLPAFAAAAGLAVSVDWKSGTNAGIYRRILLLAVFVLVVFSYASIWRDGPICVREAEINMRGRNALERQLAGWLKALPPQATLLMYLGDHVGAVQQAGIPLRHVINEGNHRVWKQPSDPDGLWERSLANPAAYADYILAFEGDSVWQAVHGRNFRELVEIDTTGQARAILYRVR